MVTGLGGEPLLILAAWERGMGEQAKGGSGDKRNPSEVCAPHRPLSFKLTLTSPCHPPITTDYNSIKGTFHR